MDMIRRPRRIVYVWDADYPWDVRTEKICRTLVGAGHEIHIVARNRAWKPTLEHLREGTVHRMRPWRLLGRRIDAQLGFPAFFSPRWTSLIARTVRDVKADLLIVRDLPLCPTTLRVGGAEGVPVILDMAENYPAMIRDTWAAGQQKVVDYVVRNPHAVEAIEKYCLPRVSHVLTVVEESSERVIALGVERGRATVVSNTPSTVRAESILIPQRRTDSLDVVYLGLLEVHRGISELLEASSILAGHGRNLRVRIIGDGRDADRFRRHADSLPAARGIVEFLGRLPYAEALSVVAHANVGVIPHHATEAWNSTVPNKLFDYMSLGLAVVSSDAKPAARIVLSSGAGATFRSGDAADFADALDRMADTAAREAAGAAGMRAVADQYNWQSDSERLLEAVERT